MIHFILRFVDICDLLIPFLLLSATNYNALRFMQHEHDCLTTIYDCSIFEASMLIIICSNKKGMDLQKLKLSNSK